MNDFATGIGVGWAMSSFVTLRTQSFLIPLVPDSFMLGGNQLKIA